MKIAIGGTYLVRDVALAKEMRFPFKIQIIKAVSHSPMVFLGNDKMWYNESGELVASVFSQETGLHLGAEVFPELDVEPIAEQDRPDEAARFADWLANNTEMCFEPYPKDCYWLFEGDERSVTSEQAYRRFKKLFP